MPLPEWVEPMAATLTQDRFTGPEWLFEQKVDGIRLLCYKSGSDVRLLSRNRLPQHCPSVAAQVAALPVGDLILDGELTWSGTAYHVFDVLWLDSRDLRALPLARAPAEAARGQGGARGHARDVISLARPAPSCV